MFYAKSTDNGFHPAAVVLHSFDSKADRADWIDRQYAYENAEPVLYREAARIATDEARDHDAVFPEYTAAYIEDCAVHHVIDGNTDRCENGGKVWTKELLDA